MRFAFDPDSGLIVVRCELRGPSGEAILRLALDTGATRTTINAAMLTAIGYDPALSPERLQVTMGSGVEYVPRIVVEKMSSLGQEMFDVPVLCHTLPPSAGIDGVLGLDFFRERRLTIDFGAGTIEVD